MFVRYLKAQGFVLMCGGLVGPIFLAVYFAFGPDSLLKWMFWTGLFITAADVLIALALTNYGAKSVVRTQFLEQQGVLTLAQVTSISETGTRINDQPLVKISLHIEGPGLTPFDSQERVIASVTRLPLITGRRLVVLVDPATSTYQIDWERSALVNGRFACAVRSRRPRRAYPGRDEPVLRRRRPDRPQERLSVCLLHRLCEGGIRRLRRLQRGVRILGLGVRGEHVVLGGDHDDGERAFPRLGAGDTVVAVIASSVGVWLFFYLILRGVKEAAVINRIATIAKVVPILVFILIAAIAFKGHVFADNFWGGSDYGVRSFSSIFEQAKGTVLITAFVFLGIEGASVYSRFARKREDVGRATVIGFLSVLSVFALVTLLSYGSLPQGELATLDQPSMASVLESIVGHWGSIFIRVGVVLSVLGAYLAWTLMAAEILYIPAKTDDMPKFLARTNAKDVPVTALVMAAGLVQLLLILLLFTSDALNFMLDLTVALSLIPYLLAAAYALKLTLTRETYPNGKSLAGDMACRGVGNGLHPVPDFRRRPGQVGCCPASCTRRGPFCTS